MKNIIIVAIFIICSININAQQNPLFTKYMFNSLMYNPAYAGSNISHGTATIIGRKQWIGFEGAPNSVLGGIEGSVKERVALGLTIGYNQLGINKETNIYSNYVYRFQVGQGLLGVGLRAGVSIFNTQYSLANVAAGDPVYDQPDEKLLSTSAGFGLYWTNTKFYVGASIPTVFIYDKKNGAYTTIQKSAPLLDRHIYFHTGGNFGSTGSDFSFEPSILVKYQPDASIQGTLGLNVWYDHKVAIGLTYRTQDAIAITGEVILNERLKIGAAYDFTTSELKNYGHGSAEIMLGYKFDTNVGQKIMNIN